MARPKSIKKPFIVLDGWTVLLEAIVCLHVVLAPFTKVEESFNVQAMHDLLFHQNNISAYDHMEFPGVVPRTFLGAMAVVAVAALPVAITLLCGFSKLAALYICRVVLGTGVVFSLSRLRSAVQQVYGRDTGTAMLLITAMQFHLPFYASRPLPNTFALALVALALADCLLGNNARAIFLLVFTTVVVRCDMVLLAGLLGLYMLLTRRVKFLDGFVIGLLSGFASLALTVAVDSVFWGRLLWPEGAVLWFNTAENRSLMAAFPLALAAPLLDRRAVPLLLIAAGFVALYSALPHKEVRFLFPVLPLWNVLAAVTLARLHRNRTKSAFWALAYLGAAAGVALSAVLAGLFTAASALNYPGGYALQRLHHVVSSADASVLRGGATPGVGAVPNLTVHVDVLPAMTGVSRFLELGPPWSYSKVEGLREEDLAAKGFTYRLSGLAAIPGYDLMDTVEGFQRVKLAWRPADLAACISRLEFPISFKTVPMVFVHSKSHVEDP